MPHKAKFHEASRLVPGHFADNKIGVKNVVKMNENDMTNKVRRSQANCTATSGYYSEGINQK